ncbi:MAG: hypothetical protein MZU95_01795, partial [Desulfomicrobium escambiense]|nr:hypothetical protein [Desulfomicrobium escambiense]
MLLKRIFKQSSVKNGEQHEKNDIVDDVPGSCAVNCGRGLEAKEKYTVTVLPFSLHSAENIEYVRQGIGDMLTSRISVSDKIEVTRKEIVQEAL